ncbi:hypothetical protein BATDEDRAFT_26763 [Batrachochytrium dendrobatidis JAM81]|uniref:Uncharacterized protein n=1 Tax=Batrachochytrium dendrobatidis (strain JAM81 / FGSC 10211) TaxID=684364 RepID=F4P8W6_BATDJ|nr:uncharacterized protein BATDEDRAFT_26763 [Batrachochytrium dendrobatidis JAM81]EGF78075.1 hypothetical protein BATDEDRAFT_26763 [Batrachochytrium dendrobatidis JAM81]|eukprot:XP_006681046.1 hypothetical protein BATDEDRAFT_26763 [Batrachochytrium dendrobatidis JAM81]
MHMTGTYIFEYGLVGVRLIMQSHRCNESSYHQPPTRSNAYMIITRMTAKNIRIQKLIMSWWFLRTGHNQHGIGYSNMNIVQSHGVIQWLWNTTPSNLTVDITTGFHVQLEMDQKPMIQFEHKPMSMCAALLARPVCVVLTTCVAVTISSQYNRYSVCRLPSGRIVAVNILPGLCVAEHEQMDWVVHQVYHLVYIMRLGVWCEPAAVLHQLVDIKVYPSRDQLHRHESETVCMVEVNHVYAMEWNGVMVVVCVAPPDMTRAAANVISKRSSILSGQEVKHTVRMSLDACVDSFCSCRSSWIDRRATVQTTVRVAGCLRSNKTLFAHKFMNADCQT